MKIHLLGHLTNGNVAVRIELHSQNYFGVLTEEQFEAADAVQKKRALPPG